MIRRTPSHGAVPMPTTATRAWNLAADPADDPTEDPQAQDELEPSPKADKGVAIQDGDAN